MNTNKKKRTAEVIAGLSFIFATIFYAIGSGFISKAFEAIQLDTQYSKVQLNIGISLELLNSVSVIIIGIMIYISLRDEIKLIAKGYLFARVMEAIILAMGSISVIAINTNNVTSIMKIYEILFPVAMLVLGVYSVYFCYTIYKKNISPSWLMILGAIGYVCLIIYSALAIFSYSNTLTMLLFIPGGLFELIFPMYLIFKGFRKPIKG